MLSKTTQNGLTSFYALFFNSTARTATFEYRHEGLDVGFRVLVLQDVNLADGDFHHVAVSVLGDSFALFIDGRLHDSQRRSLIAALEDGPGVAFAGRRLQRAPRYAGMVLA